MSLILQLVLICLLVPGLAVAQKRQQHTDTIQARFWNGPTSLDARPDKPMWRKARPITFQHNNMGEELVGHFTTVRAVWTKDELWLLFSCGYDNITIGPGAQTAKETSELWDRSDVAEAFIAPNPGDIMRYKEFQVSPAGEWVDLHIDRETANHDASWDSGYRVAARIDSGSQTWWGEMAIPLKSFGVQMPTAGTRWRANFYRIEHGPPRRGLAWQPTHQRTYHVPQAFGWLEFGR
jgi:hypothetical protein